MNPNFNPFRGLFHDELVLAYLMYSACDDVEAVALVCDAYDEDTFIDLTSFGISTQDCK